MSATPPPRRLTALIAFALATLASLVLLVLPVSSSISETRSTTGEATRQQTSETLVESQDRGVLVVLALPVLITGAVAIAPRRARRSVAIGGAILLTPLVLLAIASIGLLYMPATIALIVAAALPADSG